MKISWIQVSPHYKFKAAALLIRLLPTHSEFLLNASSTYDLLAKTITIRDSADRNIPIRFQVPDNLANIIKIFRISNHYWKATQAISQPILDVTKGKIKILASIYADEVHSLRDNTIGSSWFLHLRLKSTEGSIKILFAAYQAGATQLNI